MGVVAFAVTLGLAVALAKANVRPELRWLLAAPFFLAVFGLTQALCSTCSILAARGVRERDGAHEAVLNPQELDALRARGRRIAIASALLAIAAAGLFAEFA